MSRDDKVSSACCAYESTRRPRPRPCSWRWNRWSNSHSQLFLSLYVYFQWEENINTRAGFVLPLESLAISLSLRPCKKKWFILRGCLKMWKIIWIKSVSYAANGLIWMPQEKDTLAFLSFLTFSLFHFLPNPVALLTAVDLAKRRQVAAQIMNKDG